MAFVATVYGVGSANFIFLPVANKLKTLIAEQVVAKDMMVEGLIPRFVTVTPRMIQKQTTRLYCPLAVALGACRRCWQRPTFSPSRR